MPALIEVQYRQGIYLPEANLWLDPHFGVDRAFVSHAHSDHVARHELAFCSEMTRSLMRSRYHMGDDAKFHRLPLREPYVMDGWQLRLFPAGHIIGSAMLHLTRLSDGATLLYTGDYKLRQGLSSERCELLPAETLIMETTFGLPQFHFPPIEETVAAILKFVRETIEDGGIPVLLGYSLGKAQEILCALAALPYPVMLHKSVWDMTKVVAPLLGKLPPIEPFDGSRAQGHVLLFPPSNGRSLAIKKLKVCRTAMLSGWALTPGAKFRYQVDEVFPLSDHADYPELLETVKQVAPRRVWLVHGYTQEFAADLRARGHEAWSLEKADQMELSLFAPPTTSSATSEPVAIYKASEINTSPADPHSFQRWASIAAATAEEPSRLKKIRLLADYLRRLDEASLPLAVRYFSAYTSDPAAGAAPLNTGWALIKRALLDLSSLSEVEYRTISRSQADTGRTAFLVLSRCALEPRPLSLTELQAFFESLRYAKGASARLVLLKEGLRQRDAHDGSWLVRLLTGELRMGSREGLVEEAIAEAFDQSSEAVREAAMLSGDIGKAALLAQAHRLHEAQPRPFVPLKVMLASPEETANDIWQRHLAFTEDQSANPAWLEDKFDGIRAQLHRTEEKVEIYTRDLKPIGLQFPEIIQAAHQLPSEVILDGEIIAFAENKKLSFFDLQKRLGRRDQSDLFLPSDISVRYIAFDLLWHDGCSLLAERLHSRRKVLESLTFPTGLELINVHHAHSAEDIEANFLAARRRGNEGLIIKDAHSPYTPGRRGKTWLKLKKAFATLDVVVVRAEQGHGKRSHVLSDYTFAVRDETGAHRIIGKAYSGLTDAEIEELTEHFTRQTLSEKGRVRTVVPDTVLEIAFDSIQASSRHDSGLSLRFPRIKAIRRDKSPSEIDTLDYARKLAGLE